MGHPPNLYSKKNDAKKMASRDIYCDFNLNGGKLFKTGFEEMNVLPTNNLFVGRQVTYNNSTYIYNGVAWRKIAAIADRVYPYQCNVNLYSDATAGAIIIRTPISANRDENNSMTYLEITLYTHSTGEAVAKYLIYYYEFRPNQSYNKLSYSIIGSPAFEKVRIGYYNNNYQCIVLGDFDKTYRYHVVLNVVATGFRRTSDDTDGFEIIRDSEESNYTNLWEGYGVQFAYAKGFKVPNGTASQFLKADGSLDGNAYALQTDLNSVKNNAWKLDEANAEVSTVVIALQGDMSVFAAMDKAGINYQTSRNIYVDMSEADSTITDIFAGYENLPIGTRYHIFLGNTKHDCKINWNDSKVESNIVPSLGLTPAYPTAKCEFMRVTEEWTYADWEAKVENVSHIIDTGTASESDNSTLMNYMDNNKISYEKTTNGALVNITALLAALAGNGK